MSKDLSPSSPQVLARVGSILGIDLGDPLALAAAVTLIVPPAVSIDDTERLDHQIGLPSDLMIPLRARTLAENSPVPLELIPLLLRATTLYALAAETFGDERHAAKWWHKPMIVTVESGERSPREWSSHPAAAAELVARMRRTLTGIM